MSTAAATRSTQLDRANTADRLVGQQVRYVGRVGSAQGQTFTVTAAYADRVTLTASGADRPTLSFVRLSAIEV